MARLSQVLDASMFRADTTREDTHELIVSEIARAQESVGVQYHDPRLAGNCHIHLQQHHDGNVKAQAVTTMHNNGQPKIEETGNCQDSLQGITHLWSGFVGWH